MIPRTTEQARIAGMMGAKRALREFGMESAIRIDPFEAIAQAGAVLLFRPLQNLFGAYLPKEVTGGDVAGVLVHADHPLKLQRFTAAHELGHLWMRHEQSFDTEAEIFGRRRSSRLPPIEVAAETFSGNFLMPSGLIEYHMSHLGVRASELADPDVVYSLSLWAGVSYEATAYHLSFLKFFSPADAERIIGIPPKAIKRDRLAGMRPADPWSDVWNLTPESSGSVVYARPGDEFTFRLPSHAASGYLWQPEVLDEEAFEIVSDWVEQDPAGQLMIGMSYPRTVIVRLKSGGRHALSFVERRPWHPAVILNRIAVDVVGVEKVQGLAPQQRPRAA